MSRERKYGKKTYSVIEISGVKYVALPRDFVKSHDIAKGDTVEVVYNGFAVYRPLKDEDLMKVLEDVKQNR